MWNLKYDTNEPIYETEQTHRHREQNCGCQGEVGWRGMGWKFGVSRCKLIYIEWINNKVLLYNTGNYIQYPVINHNTKEYEKEYKHITITSLYTRNTTS